MAQPLYLWQSPSWPEFQLDLAAAAPLLNRARQEQGKVMGLFHAIGLAHAEVSRDIWTLEAMATAAIEGENLDLGMVRSSVMRRLGMDDEHGKAASRHVDGLLDVMQDAANAYTERLDDDRLCRWQAALFPAGTSGIHRIEVGKYRTSKEPMQIVSGPIGREKVHYEAPPASSLPAEMRRFLMWFDDSRPRPDRAADIDGLIRAALAHLWFEAIHPFEDGNGRVGRAIIDLALAQDTGSPLRLYSMSRQLMAQRPAYYAQLAEAQRGTLNVTGWVCWFLDQFSVACVTSQHVVSAAIEKNRFWTQHAAQPLNVRQRKAIARLLDAGKAGFEGGLSAEKYVGMTGASKATATRDLADLLQAGLLVTTGQGRATRYWINLPGWQGA